MEQISELIKNRKSSRLPFDVDREITREDLMKILEAARWTPTAHNMQNFEIIVVDDRQILESIENIKRPISESFIRENYDLLSFSEEELIKKKTGILGTMFPTSWTDPSLWKTLGKDDTGSSQRPFPKCPVMIIVVYDPKRRAPASEGDFLGVISLGCLMENMWLMADSLGIGFHIISSLSAENVENEVKRILHIPDDLKIAFSCRLGYPSFAAQNSVRVRRDIDDFTSHNKFDQKGL